MSGNTENLFAKIAFKGKRFTGGRLPLEIVGDLSTYREIIVGIAKARWKQKNPSRKQLPRGFDNYMALFLTDVTDGSACAHIEYDFSDFEAEQIFQDAQRVFVESVNAANDNGSLGHIPVSLFPKFARMGKRLEASEHLEFFTSSDWNNPVIFSNQTKENLSHLLNIEYEKTTDGFGIVTGCEEKKAVVSILCELGVIEFPVSQNAIRTDFDGRIGEVVEFSFDGAFRADRSFKKIIKPHYVDFVEDGADYERLSARLESFADLAPGWMDGEGSPPSQLAINAARDVARFLCATYTGIRAYPMLSGGVQLEFETDDRQRDISMEFDDEGGVELVLLHDDGREVEKAYASVDSQLLRDTMILSGDQIFE